MVAGKVSWTAVELDFRGDMELVFVWCGLVMMKGTGEAGVCVLLSWLRLDFNWE